MPTLISLLGQGGTLDEVLLRLNQLELDWNWGRTTLTLDRSYAGGSYAASLLLRLSTPKSFLN